MKKAILFLSTLLLLCGFAWSQGVTVSGAIAVSARNSVTTPNERDSVILNNETTHKVAIVAIDQNTRNASYSFSDVEAGKYALTYNGFVFGLYVTYKDSITVGSENVTHDIMAKSDPAHVDFTVVPQVLNNYGYNSNLEGVTVSCTIKGESEPFDTKVSTGNGCVFTYLDTAKTYVVKLSKDGYKDSTIETKVFEIQGNDVVGRSLYVLMKEDLGNQLILKGGVLIGESTTDTLKIDNLQLVASWRDKTYTTPIQSGKYAFADKIPAGEITYTLQKYENYQRGESRNWKFSNGKDTVKYTIAGADGAEVTQDLRVKRVGVTVRGLVKDTIGVEDVAFAHSVSAKIKIGNDSVTNSDFILEGISDGTHTAYITAHAHKPLEKQFAVDMANMKVDSVINFGVIYMEGQADTFLFSGNLYKYDNTLQTPVYLKNAKVVMLDGDGKKVDSAITGENGNFTIKVFCPMYTAYNFTVYSSLIKGGEVSTTRPTSAVSADYNRVELSTFNDFELDLPDPEPTEHVFYGQLYYMGENYATVYLDSAKVKMFDATSNSIVDSAYTDRNGNFEIKVMCLPTASYNFTVTHHAIDDAATSYPVSASNKRNSVYMYCVAYLPCMENVKAEQVGDLRVRLSWNWVESLVNGYTMPGKDSIYEISRIIISRRAADAQYPDVIATIMPESGSLPLSEYTDTANLVMEQTYTYFFDVYYNKPSRSKQVTDVEALSVTLKGMSTLTLSVNDEEMGTVTGAGKFYKGTEVTVKATANEGYTFVNWKSGETVIATTAEYKFILSSDSTLTANFAVAPDSCTLTLNVNNTAYGSVAGAGKFPKGTEVTVKATANTGYRFVDWKSGETVIATTAEYKFILCSDSTLTATFVANAVEPDSAVLTLNVNNTAYGSVAGAGKFPKGTEVTAKATANTGYVFVAWMKGTDTASKLAEYKFEIKEDLTLTAVFAKQTDNEKQELAAWNAYVENGQIVLTSSTPCQYAVHNISGMLIKQGRMNAGRCIIDAPKSGLYLIRRVGTGVSVRKVMVR